MIDEQDMEFVPPDIDDADTPPPFIVMGKDDPAPQVVAQIMMTLACKKGVPESTISNAFKIVSKDPFFNVFRYNEFNGFTEYVNAEDGTVRDWSDSDDAVCRRYIEEAYKFRGKEPFDVAMSELRILRKVNPVRDMVDAIEWDGQKRVETIFSEFLRAEDTPYTRECARLMFAGGINRLYRPGCKFDDMIVFVGTHQGEGKSTFVRWLAMQDELFREVNTFEGRESMDNLRGAWICEVSELTALAKSSTKEAVKSFLSRLSDDYREAYARHATRSPRRCIFVGTTNRREFYSDPSGGRRFYPVECHSTGYELFDREEEARHYIAQCWAEMREAFKHDDPFARPHAQPKLLDAIREKQAEAQEDDYRIGVIENWIADNAHVGDYVCIKQIWSDALGNTFTAPSKAQSADLGTLLSSIDCLEKCGRISFDAPLGQQRAWKVIKEAVSVESDCPF